MKGFIWAFVLLVGVYAAYSIFRIISNTAPDFSVYYGVAKNALEGRGIYGDPKLFTGYGYPPYSVLPYLPFALLSYGVSQTLFTLLSFISLVASVFLSFGLFAPKAKFETKMIATAIAFLMFPTLFTLGMGQSNLIVLLLVLLSLKFRSGVLMGLSWIIKPQLMILGLLFFLRKQWKLLINALVVVLFAAIVTGTFFGWQWYGHYLNAELPRLMEFTGREIYYNQGLEAFVSRHGLGFDIATIAKIIFLVIAIVVVRKRTLEEAVLVWLSLILLLLPLSWQHHFVFLIPAFIYLWDRKKRKMLLWVALFIIGSNIAERRSGSIAFAPLVLSHVFLGNLLVFLMLVTVRRKKR